MYSQCSKHLLPLFRDLVVGGDDATKTSSSSSSRQHLFSTWLVDNSTKLPADSPERTPDYLSRRIMALNFAAIHTSTLTTVNLLLDLFSTPSSQTAPAPPHSPEALSATEEMLRLLRDEALIIRARWGGDDSDQTAWSRARLNQMPRLDSALRESMRRWGLVPKALSRKVMPASRGVSLPDGRGHLPPGTMLCVSGWGLHHDEALYARPFDFIWDRFLGGDVNKNCNNSSSSTLASAGEEAEEAKATAVAAAETDRQFAAWGIGKHACPGRFFAVDLIKIIVAKILTDYEVQLGEQRPENIWIEYNVVPPPSATLSVRRRKAPA